MRRHKGREIDPDEILIDSSNLPHYDRSQLEGKLEKPISRAALLSLGGAFALLIAVFLGQAINLGIVHGGEYREQSENNLLRPVPIFASRGAVLDRNGMQLAWNAPMGPGAQLGQSGYTEDSVPQRVYATSSGLSHVLGYVQYPTKDSNGFYYRNDFEGVDGIEEHRNAELTGENGSRLVEVDARGKLVSESVVKPPVSGEAVTLSIDGRVQSALYANIKAIATKHGFTGGAGVIMDVRTGEIIALTSYPEYSSQAMSDRADQAAIKAALADKSLPFLNRAVDGLYTPGSIVKPFVAMGALNERVIDPLTIIHTTGSISIQSPYDPSVVNVFRDWKNHGSIDMRRALAISSDAYFYIIGGGYKDQPGLGIARIDKYFDMFGFGKAIPDSFVSGPAGVIPTPEWKEKTFDEQWFLGNTYHTVIGQYGMQITPAQAVRAVAAIANGGSLLVPTIVKGEGPEVERIIDLPPEHYAIVREGMRLGVTDGTGSGLSVPYTRIASKSGTAELGVSKANVNSWITGFWPYESPKYAFAVILEHGSVHNLIGGAAVMRNQLDWMNQHTPEYFE